MKADSDDRVTEEDHTRNNRATCLRQSGKKMSRLRSKLEVTVVFFSHTRSLGTSFLSIIFFHLSPEEE